MEDIYTIALKRRNIKLSKYKQRINSRLFARLYYFYVSIQITINLGVQKTSTPLSRICVYAQIIQRWKTLLSKITIRNLCARTSLLRICVYAQLIQRRQTLGLCYLKSLLGISGCVRKKLRRLYSTLLRLCVYVQIIQRRKTKITIRNFCACTQKASMSLLRICVYEKNDYYIKLK